MWDDRLKEIWDNTGVVWTISIILLTLGGFLGYSIGKDDGYNEGYKEGAISEKIRLKCGGFPLNGTQEDIDKYSDCFAKELKNLDI